MACAPRPQPGRMKAGTTQRSSGAPQPVQRPHPWQLGSRCLLGAAAGPGASVPPPAWLAGSLGVETGDRPSPRVFPKAQDSKLHSRAQAPLGSARVRRSTCRPVPAGGPGHPLTSSRGHGFGAPSSGSSAGLATGVGQQHPRSPESRPRGQHFCFLPQDWTGFIPPCFGARVLDGPGFAPPPMGWCFIAGRSRRRAGSYFSP